MLSSAGKFTGFYPARDKGSRRYQAGLLFCYTELSFTSCYKSISNHRDETLLCTMLIAMRGFPQSSVSNLRAKQDTQLQFLGQFQRRKWQPTPVFFPGESQGQSLAGYTAHGVARVGHDLVTKPPPQC